MPAQRASTKTTKPKSAPAETATTSVKKVKSETLSRLATPPAKLPDQAYQMLEEAIVTLQLPPGTAVSEQALAEMTGIGRTPVREAIQRLAREHLILVLPQRGLLIADIDVSKQLKLLETRRELERLICRSAAKRADAKERERFIQLSEDFAASAASSDSIAFMVTDREFNELSLKAARNEFAEGSMRMLHGLSRRFWYLHYQHSPDMPEIALLHAELARQIAASKADAAGQALDRLIDHIEHYTRATVLGD